MSKNSRIGNRTGINDFTILKDKVSNDYSLFEIIIFIAVQSFC